MALVFISYRRGDSAGYAGRLHESLEERLGAGQVFRDVDTLAPGQDFALAIEERVRDCRVLLAVIGREWLDARNSDGTRRLDAPSDYVRLEVGAALTRAEVLVIPVLVDDASVPRADQLPDVLRPLARRQAVSLHDASWDADVDRLAEAIRKGGIGTGRSGRTRWQATSRLTRALVLLAIIAVILVATFAWRVGRSRQSAVTATREGAVQTDAATTRSGQNDRARAGAAYAIGVPRLCEAVDGDLVYTVLSANVTPRGQTNELRVRVRVANDGRYDANFWDQTFRLAVGGQGLAPTSGLNEIAAGHSVRQGIVSFTIPSDVTNAVFRISGHPESGDVPLALASTGRPADDEHADAGDVLSRAIVRTLIGEPRMLLSGGDLQVTLTRVTSRRFVNALRVIVSVRYSNTGEAAVYSGALTMRAAVNDEVLAPSAAEGVVINGASSASGEFVFDLPPDATRATVRATIGDTKAEVALEL